MGAKAGMHKLMCCTYSRREAQLTAFEFSKGSEMPRTLKKNTHTIKTSRLAYRKTKQEEMRRCWPHSGAYEGPVSRPWRHQGL